jgi:hypothetical protein
MANRLQQQSGLSAKNQMVTVTSNSSGQHPPFIVYV